MSNDFGIMYKFLAKYGENNGWKDFADTGKRDGIITYGEFRNFVQNNSNEIIELGCRADKVVDLINDFFETMDIYQDGEAYNSDIKNKFALDKTELGNIENKIERYVVFNNFINSSQIQFPNTLLNSQYSTAWREAILNAINNLFESATVSNDELQNYLSSNYPAIERRVTAEFLAIQYTDQLRNNGALANYPNYKVADDETLQMLISNYISRLDADATLNEINAGIKNIIDAYLSTAGLGQNAGPGQSLGNTQNPMMVLLQQLGYNPNVLNDLQIAVLTQNIKNGLAGQASQYEGFEAEFNKAVEEFINSQFANYNSFEEMNQAINDIITAFTTSPQKERLDSYVAFANDYGDITSPITSFGGVSNSGGTGSGSSTGNGTITITTNNGGNSSTGNGSSSGSTLGGLTVNTTFDGTTSGKEFFENNDNSTGNGSSSGSTLGGLTVNTTFDGTTSGKEFFGNNDNSTGNGSSSGSTLGGLTVNTTFDGTTSGKEFFGNNDVSDEEGGSIESDPIVTEDTEAMVELDKTGAILKNEETSETTTKKSMTSNNEVYSLLVESFGVSIANAIAMNDNDPNNPYKGILNEVLARISNGQWLYPQDKDAINEFIIRQIYLNLREIAGDSATNISISNLNKLYDKCAGSDLETRKEAAIQYCEILAAKGGGYADCVKKVFGNNYESEISNFEHSSDLNAKMTQLKNLAKKVSDNARYEIKFADGVEIPEILDAGTNTSLTLSEENVPLNMTYQVSCTGSGSASISGNTLNIVAGNTSGTMTVTIRPMIDGIRVGKAKVITIEVKGSASANNGATGGVNNGGSTSGVDNKNDIDNSPTLSKYSDSNDYISSAYDEDNDEAGIQYGGHKKLKDAKEACKNDIETFINNIYNALIKEGYPASVLHDAKDRAITFFDSLINMIQDDNENGTQTINVCGEEVTYRESTYDNYTDAMTAGMVFNPNILLITQEDWWDDNHGIMIKKSYIVEIFKKEFNKALQYGDTNSSGTNNNAETNNNAGRSPKV